MEHMTSINCGISQLSAILMKNALEKKRSIRITFCEYMSHIIIISFLVFGCVISKEYPPFFSTKLKNI